MPPESFPHGENIPLLRICRKGGGQPEDLHFFGNMI
jgi:hypothetical protein